MSRKTSQRIAANVSFANVPVSINTRIIRRARIIKMDCPNCPQTYRAPNDVNCVFQAGFVANVVSGSERVSGVNTNTQRNLRTPVYDSAQVFKTMSDAFALACGVFQKD